MNPNAAMNLDMASENHIANGCADGLAFEVELPQGWAAETAPDTPVAPEDSWVLRPIWWARSTASGLQLQVSAAWQPVLPLGLPTAMAYWVGEHHLEVIEHDEARLHIGNCAACAGTAWQGRSGIDSDFFVAWAYLRHGEHLLELQLSGPPQQREAVLQAWAGVCSSWHMRSAPRCSPPPPPPAPPTWWPRAQALQAQGRIGEALKLIETECDHAGRLLAQAELMLTQMHDLLAVGHLSEAMRARQSAVSYADSYVGCATSGGEAAARLWERDNFLRAHGLPLDDGR